MVRGCVDSSRCCFAVRRSQCFDVVLLCCAVLYDVVSPVMPCRVVVVGAALCRCVARWCCVVVLLRWCVVASSGVRVRCVCCSVVSLFRCFAACCGVACVVFIACVVSQFRWCIRSVDVALVRPPPPAGVLCAVCVGVLRRCVPVVPCSCFCCDCMRCRCLLRCDVSLFRCFAVAML